ncbi:SAC3/GANP/Nin1/mts3/eIF-3 p25 family-domain-containing protein [Cunninghamella echinulata]|nr:SAC3/GANP/Nin1/mts3/eIF-3 p25 family-domain-containing protein [Cunninghamella echinulata]
MNNKQYGDDNWYGSAVIGTCTNIEKPYLRLTSAVDPRTVRPLLVLQKTYKFLRKKWKKHQNYSYICEQFKSMRQDLTVQCIRNEFTVKVYESHARIALEKGDMGEFNQCQTQLKYLYALNIKGNMEEFTAYRLLYFIFSQNQSDINSLLGEIRKSDYQEGFVEHALNVRSAIATKNYHRFFKLYVDAPNMGGYLMDKFIERERIQALQILCKGYQMGLPLGFVQQELGFESFEDTCKFFNRHGLLTKKMKLKVGITLNPKDIQPKLMELCKSFSKIDIKGQI